jgi:hypothetical protein
VSSHTLVLLSALETASVGLAVVIRSYLQKSAAGPVVKPSNFFSELKRRNVYEVAIAYGAVVWALIPDATYLECIVP